MPYSFEIKNPLVRCPLWALFSSICEALYKRADSYSRLFRKGGRILMPEQNDGKQTGGIIGSALNVSLCDWEDLYRFIYYKVQNREEAEDITQEAYARAYTFLRSNDIVIMNYASYLKSVAVNIIRDHWRTGKKEKSINIDEADPQLLAVEDFADAVLDREIVESSMKALSREQQMVLELRIIKGYSVKDTARLMDKKAGYIRVLQHRAVKALARLLGNI